MPNIPYAASPNGALHESIGTKIDTTLVPYELVLQAAIGLNYGAGKYTARNFEADFTLAQLCGSIERHNKALMDGEILDADSGHLHVSLLASSVAMLCHNWMQGRIIPSDIPAKDGLSIALLSIQQPSPGAFK
jgi:hypothetical protein